MALTGFFIPVKTVAKPLVFDKTQTQVALQKESVIYKSDAPISTNSSAVETNKTLAKQISSKSKTESSSPKVKPESNSSYSGRHNTKAENQITEDQLELFLQSKNSPLAPYSAQILKSPYWSTIIGICTIEQYGCSKAPYNNYWGIMCSGKICHYAALEDGINAISNLLAKYDSKGKNTIESLNGYYVVPASQNWFNSVLKTKQTLESLN